MRALRQGKQCWDCVFDSADFSCSLSVIRARWPDTGGFIRENDPTNAPSQTVKRPSLAALLLHATRTTIQAQLKKLLLQPLQRWLPAHPEYVTALAQMGPTSPTMHQSLLGQRELLLLASGMTHCPPIAMSLICLFSTANQAAFPTLPTNPFLPSTIPCRPICEPVYNNPRLAHLPQQARLLSPHLAAATMRIGHL